MEREQTTERSSPINASRKGRLSGLNRGDTLLEARGITKRFPGVLANDSIDFSIRAGEVHAVLGENGAGKTTLMKILFGQYQPDEGQIFIAGEPVDFKSPLDAIELGIGMVHQHRKLIPAHTAIENIILGHPHAGAVLNLAQAEKEVNALCDKYGFSIDLRAKVWQLSEGEKQLVEILKALYRGAEILIMDEPSSALTPVETDKLLDSIKAMAEADLAIVPFITHKLPIVLRISDRVTVLRRGKVVNCIDTKDATEKSLAKEMVGREVIFRIEHTRVERGDPMLEVEDLVVCSDKGFAAVDQLSFSIHAGEIFGIAGISGNGQRELVESLAGLRRIESGRITLDQQDITHATARHRWEAGIGYIPADRISMGSIGDLSLVENTALNYYFDTRFSNRGILQFQLLRELTETLVDEFDVATPGVEVKAKTLSGGNLQKLILARVLSRKPRLVIVDLPTQGLDVGATEFVRNKLIEAKQERAGVLLISEDLEEIMSLSDWVAPIYEGRFMSILPAEEVEREFIGALMAGIELEGLAR